MVSCSTPGVKEGRPRLTVKVGLQEGPFVLQGSPRASKGGFLGPRGLRVG